MNSMFCLSQKVCYAIIICRTWHKSAVFGLVNIIVGWIVWMNCKLESKGYGGFHQLDAL